MLFGWVGPGGFCIRCNSAKQKAACKEHGCSVMVSDGHKGDNYYSVPESVQKDGKRLRALAEALASVAPPGKAQGKAARN
jgi:hypothetical protein